MNQFDSPFSPTLPSQAPRHVPVAAPFAAAPMAAPHSSPYHTRPLVSRPGSTFSKANSYVARGPSSGPGQDFFLPYHGSTPSSPTGSKNVVDHFGPDVAYQSAFSHFVGVWVPMVYFTILLGAMWGLTIATQMSQDHKIEIRSESFYRFGVTYPTLLVAIYTFISSLLNAMLLWSFSRAVSCFARSKLCQNRQMSLRGLSALASAKDGAFPMSNFGTKWMWLGLICWGSFLTTTTGFNTVILPTRRSLSQPILATELDFSDPAFLSFYQSVDKSQYYNCSRWADTRGIMLSPCPAGTAFTAITYSGVAQYESREEQALTYVRLGPMTTIGSTRGTLPFTSFDPAAANAFQSAGGLKRLPYGGHNYSIAFDLQGLGATISCRDLSTSPILANGVACDSPTPAPVFPANSAALHMRAAYCTSTTSPGSYDFHMRFYGDYIHHDSSGNPRNENITCSITPKVTTEKTVFHSFDNATWFSSDSTPLSSATAPSDLFEHVLQTLVTMIVTFGQNSVDNLFAETIVQLTTSYAKGNYTAWPLVAQRQLEGMISYLASYEKVLAEDYITRNNVDLPKIVTSGQMSHDTFAYSVSYPNYLLLLPITVGCLLGILLLIKGAPYRRHLKFDPMAVTSLIIASSSGQLQLYEAAKKGADPNDHGALATQMSFEKDTVTAAWGLAKRL